MIKQGFDDGTSFAGRRTDCASRLIKTSPEAVYQAFLDPDTLVTWLAPAGMTGQIHKFEPCEGGLFTIALIYDDREPTRRGKTSEDTDVVQGRFLELVPNARIVQAVEFESDDPDFAGEMRITWNLNSASGGVDVVVTCENVPPGVRQEDHDVGLRSTLENLARLLER